MIKSPKNRHFQGDCNVTMAPAGTEIVFNLGRLAQSEPSSATHVIRLHRNRRAALALRQPEVLSRDYSDK